MKYTTLLFALCVSLCSVGQEAHIPNLRLVGELQERAADDRDRAWLSSLVGAVFAGSVLFTDGKDEHINQKDRFAAWCILSAGVTIHIGLNIRANGRERRAARILQGRSFD